VTTLASNDDEKGSQYVFSLSLSLSLVLISDSHSRAPLRHSTMTRWRWMGFNKWDSTYVRGLLCGTVSPTSTSTILDNIDRTFSSSGLQACLCLVFTLRTPLLQVGLPLSAELPTVVEADNSGVSKHITASPSPTTACQSQHNVHTGTGT
jgi:hypothetical protein